MAQTAIDRLIISSPYEEPKYHWRYDRETRTFDLAEGRRPAGYVVASGESRTFDDPGIFVEIPLVNQIRPRVRKWREDGYPGVTSITKRLLEHWRDPEEFERRRFFFCQLEAMETLIWLAEAPAAERVGIEIPGDGGDFLRRCCKMATGTGKTFVMAMTIAWHILNKVANPQDARFSKNVLVIAPGLTVKNRLAVLEPAAQGNYYEAFDIVPSSLLDKLRQGKVLVRNWHALAWDSEEQLKKRKSVDKRGAKSDEAYTREVLGEMANARNLLVINDEAHHAWRVNWEAEAKEQVDSGQWIVDSEDAKDSPTNHSPLITNHSPLTTNHSPLTTGQTSCALSACFNLDWRWIGRRRVRWSSMRQRLLKRQNLRPSSKGSPMSPRSAVSNWSAWRGSSEPSASFSRPRGMSSTR